MDKIHVIQLKVSVKRLRNELMIAQQRISNLEQQLENGGASSPRCDAVQAMDAGFAEEWECINDLVSTIANNLGAYTQ